MDICRCLAESERRTMSGILRPCIFIGYILYTMHGYSGILSPNLQNLVEVSHYEDSDRRITH